MKLRTLWKILDLLAVIISAPAVLYSLPFSLLMLFGIISNLLEPAKIIAGLKWSIIVILFTGFGAAFGVVSLAIAALISAKKICARLLFKSLIIAGLISGIITAAYHMRDLVPFGKESTYFMDINFVWTGSYMVLSAIVHIIEMLRTKVEH